jgi:hypothetical protein
VRFASVTESRLLSACFPAMAAEDGRDRLHRQGAFEFSNVAATLTILPAVEFLVPSRGQHDAAQIARLTRRT